MLFAAFRPLLFGDLTVKNYRLSDFLVVSVGLPDGPVVASSKKMEGGFHDSPSPMFLCTATYIHYMRALLVAS